MPYEPTQEEVAVFKKDMELDRYTDEAVARIVREGRGHSCYVRKARSEQREKKKMDECSCLKPDPWGSLESAELVVVHNIRTKDGKLVSRNKRVYELDPHQFSMSEQQQFEHTRDHTGKIVETKKVGRPVLVAQGVVIGSRGPSDFFHKPIHELPSKELTVLMEKTADLVSIEVLWEGNSRGSMQALQSEIFCAMSEQFNRRLMEFCEKMAEEIGTDKVTPRSIRYAMSEAAEEMGKKYRR